VSTPGAGGGRGPKGPSGELGDRGRAYLAWLLDLFVGSARLYRAHIWKFVAIAGGVVTVVDVILGIGLGELTSGYQSRPSSANEVISLAASAFVTTPLITTMLAQAVVDIRAGEQWTSTGAVQRGLDLFTPVLIVIVLYVAAVIAGFFAFVVPGVFIAVSWYFVAQAVVIENRRGFAALSRSGELVRGNWWRALGAGLAFNIAVAVPSSVVKTAFDAAAKAADAQGLLVLGNIVYEAFALPFVAVGATLFYLQLREASGAGPGRR
jgi:hypothetical protein